MELEVGSGFNTSEIVKDFIVGPIESSQISSVLAQEVLNWVHLVALSKISTRVMELSWWNVAEYFQACQLDTF